MRIYDISMEINPGMPVYKNRDEKRPAFRTIKDFSTGSVYESRVDIEMHTGTHIDAPLHMIENGGTIDQLSLESVITRCKVFDFTHITTSIGKEDLLPKNIEAGDFVILKTRNSYTDVFDSNFVYLDKSGASYLKELGIKGVGIDALGIERDQPGHETHKVLLGAGIVILEGLRLKDVNEGGYFLSAAPLRLDGLEAAPVRAVLLDMAF